MQHNRITRYKHKPTSYSELRAILCLNKIYNPILDLRDFVCLNLI